MKFICPQIQEIKGKPKYIFNYIVNISTHPHLTLTSDRNLIMFVQCVCACVSVCVCVVYGMC